jgi:hypothetical protein
MRPYAQAEQWRLSPNSVGDRAMSWFASVGPTGLSDFPSALEAAQPNGQDAQEVQEQLAAAKKTALELVKALGVADEGVTVGCSLSGHVVTGGCLNGDQTAALAVQVYQTRTGSTQGFVRPSINNGKRESQTPALAGDTFYAASVT